MVGGDMPWTIRPIPPMALVPHEELEGVEVPLRNLPRFLTNDQVVRYLMANQQKFAGRRLMWIESYELRDRIDYANCIGEIIPMPQPGSPARH